MRNLLILLALTLTTGCGLKRAGNFINDKCFPVASTERRLLESPSGKLYATVIIPIQWKEGDRQDYRRVKQLATDNSEKWIQKKLPEGWVEIFTEKSTDCHLEFTERDEDPTDSCQNR
jgi:hypothetical protein